eukprot:1139377-Pelagomonas_calceolata.AAC.10
MSSLLPFLHSSQLCASSYALPCLFRTPTGAAHGHAPGADRRHTRRGHATAGGSHPRTAAAAAAAGSPAADQHAQHTRSPTHDRAGPPLTPPRQHHRPLSSNRHCCRHPLLL